VSLEGAGEKQGTDPVKKLGGTRQRGHARQKRQVICHRAGGKKIRQGNPVYGKNLRDVVVDGEGRSAKTTPTVGGAEEEKKGNSSKGEGIQTENTKGQSGGERGNWGRSLTDSRI